MADHVPETHKRDVDPMIEKASEMFHASDSSSSDSDDDKNVKSSASKMKSKIYHIFGRGKSVHKVMGGGKPADIFLWRNKKASGAVLGVATTIWVLFEVVEYHLLSLVCYLLIVGLVIVYASSFISKAKPKVPEVVISEDVVLRWASTLTRELNGALAILRDIALGRNLKKLLAVIAGLWIVSIIGNLFNFLTLCYTGVVLMYTLPAVYEKYQVQVDALAEKAEAELKKQYEVFEAKVLSKLPKSAKDKFM